MESGFTAQAAMFEGLFVHSLDVRGEFAQALKAVGFDREDIKASYDKQVWNDCLDVATARLYPHLPRFEGWQRLGRLFIEGYFQTMVGRLISMALPFMNAERFVTRVPQYVRTGLGGSLTEVELIDAGAAQITLRGPHEGSAWVLSGVLEVCFERLHQVATLKPEALGGVDSRIQLTWHAPGDAAAPTDSERQSARPSTD